MSWLPDFGKGWLIVIPGAILIALCMQDYRFKKHEPDHMAIIQHTLNASSVSAVVPPDGPFNMQNDSSRYFIAYVAKTERTYYVEAYVSMWSIASDTTVYRYKYWREMPLGLYLPIKT